MIEIYLHGSLLCICPRDAWRTLIPQIDFIRWVGYPDAVRFKWTWAWQPITPPTQGGIQKARKQPEHQSKRSPRHDQVRGR
jgi:hypothetical protein